MAPPLQTDYLGWRKENDLRNLNHLLRATLAPEKPRSRHWSMPLPAADQGATGTCVGHSGWHRLVTTPVSMDPRRIPSPFDLYRQAVLLDQWSDNDGDATAPQAALQAGTSTLGLMKALVELKLISRYVWAYTADDLIAGVSHHGPVNLGIAWFNSMFEPDGEGFIHLDQRSGLAGGHELLVIGWDQSKGVAEILNSWGPGWGKRGRCYLSGEDLRALLEQLDGEAATPTEIRPKV
jgi:hypothetical protein